MVTNSKIQRADRFLIIGALVLIIFGIVSLVSASAPEGYAKFKDGYWFVKRQLLFGFLPGIALFFLIAKISYRRLHQWGPWLYAGSLVLLALVFVSGIGVSINGSRSWLQIFGFNLQPSELVKLTLIIVLARVLTTRPVTHDTWRENLLPVLAWVAPAVLLVLGQPDLGTTSILAVIVVVMLYLSGVPVRFLVVLGLVGVAAFAALIIAAPYRTQRLTTFLHPEFDPRGVGYQVNQAFLAVGSGGLWGFGLGHSRQKFQYLPEVSADSIYAVIAEELGFFVATAFVLGVLFFGWRIFQIARRAPDQFGMLVAGGIGAWFLWQSFLNMGAMVGALPLTGVPLPFVSHGGSAIFSVCAAVGVVASISRERALAAGRYSRF